MHIVFDSNGPDLLALAFREERPERDLLAIAIQLAAQRDVSLGGIAFRFAPGEVTPSMISLLEPASPPANASSHTSIQLVFEEAASDLLTRPHKPDRPEKDLLSIARQLAAARGTNLSTIRLRFDDPFEELLEQFPPEELARPGEPDYDLLQQDGGCRPCASGTPCRERIRHDIADILLEAGLPEDAQLACLEWMIREGCSSLTRSTLHMAEGFGRDFRTEQANIIAAQNDAFRSVLGTAQPPLFDGEQVPGIAVMTQGIQAMSLADQAQILRQIREFDRWTPDNDPHGEHDFGSFAYQGERIFFKFDYYDNELTFGSENPADLLQTMRVLTVMTAQEY